MNYLFSASHSDVFECLLMSSENILVLFPLPVFDQKQYATVSLLLFASFYLIFIYFHFLYEKKKPQQNSNLSWYRGYNNKPCNMHARSTRTHTHTHARTHFSLGMFCHWNINASSLVTFISPSSHSVFSSILTEKHVFLRLSKKTFLARQVCVFGSSTCSTTIKVQLLIRFLCGSSIGIGFYNEIKLTCWDSISFMSRQLSQDHMLALSLSHTQETERRSRNNKRTCTCTGEGETKSKPAQKLQISYTDSKALNLHPYL